MGQRVGKPTIVAEKSLIAARDFDDSVHSARARRVARDGHFSGGDDGVLPRFDLLKRTILRPTGAPLPLGEHIDNIVKVAAVFDHLKLVHAERSGVEEPCGGLEPDDSRVEIPHIPLRRVGGRPD